MHFSDRSLSRGFAVLLALATALTLALGTTSASAKPGHQKSAHQKPVAGAAANGNSAAGSASNGSTDGATCSRPASDADYLEIYAEAAAWDHSDLTVYVKLQPQTTTAQARAVRAAVARWDEVLDACLDGAVSLTEVSSIRDADIVLRFLPAAGGASFLGIAICHGNASSPSQCNVIVSGGEGASGLFGAASSPTDVYYTALHEIGHVLGLGHAQPILDTHDLMGYGWGIDGVAPVLSQCDVDALASIWSWAIAGTAPAPATETTYDWA